MALTAEKMIEKYLKDNGYDGLFCEDCGCEVGDLCPCGEIPLEAEAGYKQPCDCGDHDYHIGADKP